jgi:hypothetical protein
MVDALENKLKESEDLLEKFSSNNLKSMLCIHTDISNKLDLIVNDLSTSTSHNSKDSGTQGKFVPICHHCGKVGHIRPKCYLLKSRKPWKKQEDSRRALLRKPLQINMFHPIGGIYLKEVRTLLFVKMLILNW